MVNAYPNKSRLVYLGSPRGNRRSIERQMSIMDAGARQRCDDAIVFSDVGYGTDAHSIHSAARDFIVAHEYLAVAAPAQFLHQPLGVLGIAECAGLNEKRRWYGDLRDRGARDWGARDRGARDRGARERGSRRCRFER